MDIVGGDWTAKGAGRKAGGGDGLDGAGWVWAWQGEGKWSGEDIMLDTWCYTHTDTHIHTHTVSQYHVITPLPYPDKQAAY